MTFTPRIEEKTWNPSSEGEIFREWERTGIYRFHPNTENRVFTIDTPPPYPSGRPWHIGAAAHYSQIDMIARTARMLGYEAFFPIGIDRNGLPVELYTERTFKVSLRTTPREKFIELCRHALDDLEAEMIGIMKTMGLSGGFERYYRTDSEEYRSLTQATFIELWRRGLIYEATRPNNYCVDCRTTIADAEVSYGELPTNLVYIRFKVKESGNPMIIATTRPELLCSCRAVLVNPEDERYLEHHGLHAITPVYEREIPIIAHPSAKAEFGSGAVMVCSYGDYTDVLLFRELGLKEIIAINEEGRMTSEAGRYEGLRLGDARKEIVDDLSRLGLVDKVEEIVHRTPMCERSRTPIEIIPMKEFYLKQLDHLPTLKKIGEDLIFHPEAHRQILLDWINSIRIDWPITRRRYYATEVPIWYCKRCGEPHLPEPGRYHRPWIDASPYKTCVKCGESEFVGDTRTFDTWMDSSVSPLFISEYLNNEIFFRKTYPNTIRPQAKDIVRTWLYYTLLRCHQLTGKAPFQHVWVMGYGVDEKGERMSKSKGNVIDPIPILKRYGADVFRLWAAAEANLGSDFRCSEARISGAKKFLTKLWNLSRFISSFEQPAEANLTYSDKWILGELSKLVEECREGYKNFNFFVPANRVREFAWNTFAAHYVEMAKARAYGSDFGEEEQKASWLTLHTCLRTILILLAPVTPFITEKVWRRLYNKESIHLQRFTEPVWSKELTHLTQNLIDFNSKVWNEKKAKGLSLKEPLAIEIPGELRLFSPDLSAMHNLA